MNVEDLMTKSCVVCHPDDSLAVVAAKMWTHDVSWMPVVDADGRVVGVINDRDTFAAGHSSPAGSMCVSDVAAVQPLCCGPLDSILRVTRFMREHRVLRIPVIDQGGRLLGVLSLDDIAHELPLSTACGALAG